MNPNRRTVLIGLGSIVTGSVATTLVTQNTKAASIENSTFDIPNQDKTVNNPVQNAKINASGSFSIDANAEVTRVVLRLEATTTDTYTQLGFQNFSPNAKQFSGDFSIGGTIVDIPTVGQDDINPVDRGTSKSLDLSVRLILEVYSDGSKIASDTVKDDFTFTVSKAEAGATMSLDATGNMTVVT